MMDFLNIPEKCRFSTPKIIKIDHISKGQESQCQTISSIEWLGTISPVSANVTSYTDEYQSYNEIQILHICASDTNDLYHAVKAIYRAILYPTLLVVQYKDKYLLSACAYQIGKMDSDKIFYEIQHFLIGFIMISNLMKQNCLSKKSICN